MTSSLQGKKVSDVSKKPKSNGNEGNDRSQSENAPQKERVARWEKQWVAISNVVEFLPEIWVKKWVLVHDSFDARKRSDSHSQYSEFSAQESVEERVPKRSRKDPSKKHACQFSSCGKVFSDSGSLRKHMATHGEKTVRSRNL
eukprot:TRINITY_DN5443_c0_g2_i1.p3 TRINITY_DN5443_c0_g2~~TRINITY_DN5443_c0_g2_i1.p3  ORF type:complete len:143 (-),score=35.06 TRINITY_DN5443_c0_g2_i1:354-782(-)